MNKAITDGLVLMPPPFAAGLTQWSSENGTPGSATYFGAANAALVAGDQNFGGCLELLKTQTTQKLRFMGETPILPGCYLRVTARVKAISGNFPAVRIAGWAGSSSTLNVAGVVQVGASTTLTTYGEVRTITAIIGTGSRTGVDMIWGTQPILGHFGLDLTGATGGVVRIDDIEIEDVTSVFLRVMLDVVDVRDFGAIGNGVADDTAAFQAADAASAGRTVLISKGTYLLGDHVTFVSPVRFEGTVTMPVDKRLSLTRNFDYATYVKGFGDEVVAFKKALQALFNFTDHVSLNLNGRKVDLDQPIDVRAVVGNIDTLSTRRTLENGSINATPSTNWNTQTVSSQASYSVASPYTLSAVANVANIPVGSLITGNGVGREVYVRARNIGASTLTLSLPLFAAAGTQNYTFKRFKYLLDFSGFAQLDKFEIKDVEFQCDGEASAVMLAPQGAVAVFSCCLFVKPKDRGITSIGDGCQGMTIDQCQFLSNEQPLLVADRTTIALNINGNDVKFRCNRVVRFAHFAIAHGSGHMFVGNHWFHGDVSTAGIRRAGLVLTEPNVKSIITGNYIDNSFIEWSNERDSEPAFSNEFSFGGLTITGNIFTVSDVAPFFRWLVITPRGPNHYLQGLAIQGNTFKSINGTIDRIEAVDTTFATLDFSRTRNVVINGNDFNGITQTVANPVTIEHLQSTAATTWTVDPSAWLPFGFWARKVVALVAEGAINGPGSEVRTEMPYTLIEQGTSKQQVKLNWSVPARGKMQVTVRCDSPN